MDDTYNLHSSRDRHAELIRQHQPFLQDKAYGVTDELAQMILECAGLAESRPDPERDGAFLEAFMLLASKVLSHLESARLLLNVGRYGDVAVIVRGLFSDVMTIQYLSLFPTESEAWLDLARGRPPEGARDKVYGAKLRSFQEPRMRSEIEKARHRPITSHEAFAAYSEATHAGTWGVRFYAYQEFGRSATFTVQFKAAYQPHIALAEATMLGVMAAQVMEDFLSWCEDQGVDWHKDVLDRWLPVQPAAYRKFSNNMSVVEEVHDRFFKSERQKEE